MKRGNGPKKRTRKEKKKNKNKKASIERADQVRESSLPGGKESDKHQGYWEGLLESVCERREAVQRRRGVEVEVEVGPEMGGRNGLEVGGWT